MKPVITSAMVLAAGLGTRMRPLTDHCPKPLIKVGGTTMLDRALDMLPKADITHAVVNVHYLPELVEAHCAARTSPHIAISDERARLLDSGGGTKKALPLLGDHFLILNADSFWVDDASDNLARLIAAYDPARMDMAMLLAERPRSIGFDWAGDFFMDKEGRLTRRGAAATSPYAYMGAFIVSKAQFGHYTDDVFSLNRLWDESIKTGRLYGQVLDGFWYHVGTPAALTEAEAHLRANCG